MTMRISRRNSCAATPTTPAITARAEQRAARRSGKGTGRKGGPGSAMGPELSPAIRQNRPTDEPAHWSPEVLGTTIIQTGAQPSRTLARGHSLPCGSSLCICSDGLHYVLVQHLWPLPAVAIGSGSRSLTRLPCPGRRARVPAIRGPLSFSACLRRPTGGFPNFQYLAKRLPAPQAGQHAGDARCARSRCHHP